MKKPFVRKLTAGIVLAAGVLMLRAVAADSNSIVTTDKRFPYFQSEPVSYFYVKMQDGFWSPRQKIVHDVTVPWATRHFDTAGGLTEFKKRPRDYQAQAPPGDVEALKMLEGLAAVVGLQRDASIEGLTDAWGKKHMDGQGKDGYLDATYLASAPPAKRWEPIWNSHEDYFIGHYLEAGIGYRESTGNSALYDSAVRAVDNMAATFLGNDRAYAPGHEEISQALMRLYALTGDTKYLRLCGSLIAQRGNHQGRPSYGLYSQDHIPVKDQRTIEGHAVRAAFLFNGVTEYVGATGDAGYRAALLSIWDDFEQHKMFLHGAGGNLSAGNEGYDTKPYYIPPDDCYGESCSVFGNFQWAHNLFRLTGDAHYLDTAERMIYNAFYASLSLSGDHFFYRNLTQTDGPIPRFDWSGDVNCPVACCPPNIVKLFSKIGGYFYSTDADGIFVKHYGASTAEIPFGDGVRLVQRTDYPWNGDIRITVTPKRQTTFTLRLRQPVWAKSPKLKVNGKLVAATANKGWLSLRRKWKSGDRVELSLPMEIERVTMPPEFKEYENRAALQRGPIVYCLEAQDVAAPLESLYIPENAKFTAEHRPDFLGGVTVLHGNVRQVKRDDTETNMPAIFVPYGVWDNRMPSEMRVWLAARKMELPALPDLFPTASHTHAADSVIALNDGVLPKSSGDQGLRRWTWWPHLGSSEWVEYRFSERIVNGVDVYWFQDAGGCRVPESWTIQYWTATEWLNTTNAAPCGIALDGFNTVAFAPVKTTRLRLVIQAQKNFAGGILEWRLLSAKD